MTVEFRLEASYLPDDGDGHGTIELRLFNLSTAPIAGFVLAWSALTRAARDAVVDGGTLLRRVANFHEVAPPENFELAPGAAWTVTVTGLTHTPRHRLDGPKSAYLTLADGTRPAVAVGDMMLAGGDDTGETKAVPDGRIAVPLSVIPWPAEMRVEATHDAPPPIAAAPSATAEDLGAVARIAGLARRLHPAAEPPFVLATSAAAVPLSIAVDDTLAADGYHIDFAHDGIALRAGGPAGRDYGLITLAQIRHGALTDPARFAVPSRGTIADAPRYPWRGCHLDVSRHFHSAATVTRLIDILAWNKMNVFQWHLTDDEGWRLEIAALPQLTEIGAWRGADHAQAPQLGSGAATYGGFYSRDEVRAIVAHAADLHIDVVPEIDIPGHCTAVLHALPHLRDPNEPADSYRSIQGYPNNALNPAIPETYTFLKTVFAEVAELFPSPYIHIGGDEVDAHSWLASPLARDLMARENLADTPELQAYFSRKAQAIVLGLGKKFAGWDEVADGGGVNPDDTLLVAWRQREKVAELVAGGYDVVASPGQAFYLDMVQASGWHEPGTSWAGVSTPEGCYAYDPEAGLDPNAAGRLAGVQAGIWSEHLISRPLMNHMMFPRLGAIAEAGWTPAGGRDWPRFAALSRLMPEL